MDKAFMKEAIALARKGVAEGDGGPFGAVVVKDGKIVGRGWNQVIGQCDPTAHAEIMAIRDAADRLQDFHLDGCDLYTSCEPCPMCLSAAYWAHIRQIFYAASEEDAAKLGFDDRFIREELGCSPEVRRLPMRQMLRLEALEVFAEWERSEQKKPY
ncbi:nucleoside deaminase [Solemya velesiana gill symbiont]|uniref:tRNA-specific adenosine deaminase n=1 Tax=Solemya velesiana gill symbiont TaxID=1918948 RepID=A0A1T2KUL3_9GAMM|nr:nucleoside deaminase [Solemya velesiana gill symbiont]OOZ36512.1 tRNA-specific adenosine deaminase [Solemya velesiana gill symbiont]